VDETRLAGPLPSPDDAPAKDSRNTAAFPTDLMPGQSREYPEVPGYEILGILAWVDLV
jgi:hypothetical protein